MEIVIRDITKEEKAHYEQMFPGGEILKDKVAIDFIETGEKDGSTILHEATQYLSPDEITRYGEEYIRTHTKLVYNEVCECYFAETDHALWHNDLSRNPQKVIDVEFVGMREGENTEIWKKRYLSKDETSPRYYLRLLSGDNFSRWMTCTGPQSGFMDQGVVRPNIVFRNGSQTEKVTFNDWNGSAAYSDTFNQDFRNNDVPRIYIPDDDEVFSDAMIWGDYVLTPCEDVFNNKVSFWLSKRDCTIAVYCFSAEKAAEVRYQTTFGLDGYIRLLETMLTAG